MSTLSDIGTQGTGGGTIAQAVGRAILRWWCAYTAWRTERWAINRLRAMSDRQLDDIGLLRSEIEPAVRGTIARDRALAACSGRGRRL